MDLAPLDEREVGHSGPRARLYFSGRLKQLFVRWPDGTFVPLTVGVSGPALKAVNETLLVTEGNHRCLTEAILRGPKTDTLGVAGASDASWLALTRMDSSPFSYAIVNGGPGGGTLVTMSSPGVAVFRFNGTDWSLQSFCPF